MEFLLSIFRSEALFGHPILANVTRGFCEALANPTSDLCKALANLTSGFCEVLANLITDFCEVLTNSSICAPGARINTQKITYLYHYMHKNVTLSARGPRVFGRRPPRSKGKVPGRLTAGKMVFTEPTIDHYPMPPSSYDGYNYRAIGVTLSIKRIRNPANGFSS